MENREFQRVSTNMRMQVYTSLCAAAYTVSIDDISPKGAFVKTEHLPEVGEVISFNVCDRYYRYLLSGSAKVLRVIQGNAGQESGFAIEFDKKILDESFKKIVQ